MNPYPIDLILISIKTYKKNFDQRASSVDSITVLLLLSQTLISVLWTGQEELLERCHFYHNAIISVLTQNIEYNGYY